MGPSLAEPGPRYLKSNMGELYKIPYNCEREPRPRPAPPGPGTKRRTGDAGGQAKRQREGRQGQRGGTNETQRRRRTEAKQPSIDPWDPQAPRGEQSYRGLSKGRASSCWFACSVP